MWRDANARRVRVLAVTAFAALAACDNEWRTDMWYQPSHRPEDSPRLEPEHSVPLGAGPHFADRDDASDTGHNPVAADDASVQRGAITFRERCLACHGAQGHGGGPVSKFFPPAPDLAYAAVKARSDGYLYGTVTFGGRAMPPLGEGLTPRDRWDLVNFVRARIQEAPDAGSAP